MPKGLTRLACMVKSNSSEMFAVELETISKTYNNGELKAVNEVSFSIEKGELFGLIGPDGAGKTSIFRILTTLLLPDQGRASVVGYDVVKDYREIRKRVGYMPGKFSLYQDLTIQENLEFFATVFGTTIEENYDLIRDIYVQIEPFRHRRAGKLSGGMKQKLALCCALIHRPELLLLDEPTTGVDTVSRKEFWEMLKRLKQEGITILVSTPYMDEATLCERIALIDKGHILSIDTPNGILGQFPKPMYAIKSDRMSPLLRDIREYEAVDSCYAFGEYHHITFRQADDVQAQNLLVAHLQNLQHQALEIKTITPTIEDCFINLLVKA
jgi:ABC-2 type transport system ATP-binding protein